MDIIRIVQKRVGEKLPVFFCEKSARELPGPRIRKPGAEKCKKNTLKKNKKSFKKHLTSFKIYSIMNTERQKKEGIKNER
jgi:hypothetical protein